MSHRPEKIASTLQRALADIISRGLADPRVRGLVTITSVSVTRDLKLAKVKFTVLPREHENLTHHGLKSAAGTLRRELQRKVDMREIPELRFEIDQGLHDQATVIDLLAKAKAEDAARGASQTFDAQHPGTDTPAEDSP